VFFQGFDEHHVSVATLFSQGDSFFLDGLSSFDVPLEVGLGVFDFLFEFFSVFSGFVSDGFVLVGDGQQLGDLTAQGFFHSSVDFIGTGLRVDVGLFQVVQELEGGVNGISGSGLHVHQVLEGGLEF